MKINYKTFRHAINTFISLKQREINIDIEKQKNTVWCKVLVFMG